MSKFKASVIIPTKNPGKNFPKVIDSVINQSVSWPYEVIIVDSGSTDGTLDYCRKLSSIVCLLEISSEEFGHGKTRNYAASHSSGEFIVFLTHDALPANNQWLSNLIAGIEESENIAGAFGRHLPYPSGNPFIARDLQMHFDNFLNNPAIAKIEDRNRYDSDIAYRQFLHFFSNNNSCVRSSVFNKIPFPEVDFSEDQIWAMEVLQAGYSKKYVDDAAVFHSHDYAPLELFKRSVDESRALSKIFGYQLCPTISQLVSQVLKTTLRDVRFAIDHRIVFSEFYWFSNIFSLNLAKQLGFFIGQRLSNKDDGIALNALSLDRAIKMGHRKT